MANLPLDARRAAESFITFQLRNLFLGLIYTFHSINNGKFPTWRTTSSRSCLRYSEVWDAPRVRSLPTTRRWSRVAKLEPLSAWLGLDPSLTDVKDPIPILQMFAHLVRQVILTVSCDNLRKRSVEQYLRSVGQTFACVATKNPRLVGSGKQTSVWYVNYHIPKVINHWLESVLCM